MKTTITFELDTDRLDGYTDEYLAQLWHISQANPAPFGDRQACEFTEKVGREIIRRFLGSTPPALWTHQGRHTDVRLKLVPAPELPVSEGELAYRLDTLVLPGEWLTTAEIHERLHLPDVPGQLSALTSVLRALGFIRRRFQRPDGLRSHFWGKPDETNRPESPAAPPAVPCTHPAPSAAFGQSLDLPEKPNHQVQPQPSAPLGQNEFRLSGTAFIPSAPSPANGGSVPSTEGGAA